MVELYLHRGITEMECQRYQFGVQSMVGAAFILNFAILFFEFALIFLPMETAIEKE